jgi:hypothetical protein
MQKLKQLIDLIEGKKTYITSVIFALFEVLKSFELISLTEAQNTSIRAFLGVLLAISVRQAIQKAEPKRKKK